MHTKTTFRFLLAALLISFAFLLTACGDSQSNGQSQASSESASNDKAGNGGGDEKTFRIAWSIYVGWMPWAYAEQSGILDKWAKRYGIKIELVQINDYIESINQYTAGAFDGCTMTNMDALTIPAAGGVDSTALIVGDYSDGNDGVVLKDSDKLEDIKGMDVNLVALSVSHYLLARALDSVGLSEKDVNVVNTSDADIVGAYESPDVKAVAAWNPQLATILDSKQAHEVFDSKQIPGEILDMMVVNSDTLKANPELGKALVGAWYETMATMQGDDDAAQDALTKMASAAGTDLAGYKAQLEDTHMFYTPQSAVDFTTQQEFVDTMDKVRQFSFDHGLLGEGASSPDVVGISFPGDRSLGDTGNTKLRFDVSYMRMAAQDELEGESATTE